MPKNKQSVPTYDFLKKLNSLVSLEYSKLEKAYNSYDSSHAHRHDYYEVLVFEKSGGTHEIDFVSYPVIKNTIHFILPGQVHLLRRNKNVTGHVIAFKEEAFVSQVFAGNELLMPSSAVAPVIKLERQSLAKINKSLSNLISEYENSHEYSVQSLSAYLMIFLIDVIRVIDGKNKIRSSNVVDSLYHKFRRLVDKNILTLHSVGDYAKLLNVTPGHLNDSVKQQSGKSASDIIHERLVLESKRFLYHSSLSIKEISVSLNYDDPAYFSRFFRKHVGLTPLEFREKARG